MLWRVCHDVTMTWHWRSRRDYHHLSHFRWNKWYRLDPGVDFTIFEAEKPKNDERIFVELTRDLESDCDVTISVTCHIFFYYTWHVIDIGIDFTIFETEKLKNDKRIYIELTRDLKSDCDVTISVTFRIFSTTHDTLSILVSILPYSRLRNSKMIKLFMYSSRVT